MAAQDPGDGDPPYARRAVFRDGAPRRRTMARRELSLTIRREQAAARASGRLVIYEEELARDLRNRDRARPRTRGECWDADLQEPIAAGPGPCVYVSCPFNLYLDVSPGGAIKFNFPQLEPQEMPEGESCALDVAARGGVTLEEIGRLYGMTRERIRQIEARAVRKLRAAALQMGIPIREILAAMEAGADDGGDR